LNSNTEFTTSGPTQYGLLLYFIGICGVSASLLGGSFGIGLAYANGGLNLQSLLVLRDAVLGVVLGVTAIVTGYHVRRGWLRKLVVWEWVCWLVVGGAIVVTILGMLLAPVGIEFAVFLLFYLLLAVSATSMRRKYCLPPRE